MTVNPDVVIVGAGAAGIAATRQLAASALSTIVLEATARVGGRAWTHDIANMQLDLAADGFTLLTATPETASPRPLDSQLTAAVPRFVSNTMTSASRSQNKQPRGAPSRLGDTRWIPRLPPVTALLTPWSRKANGQTIFRRSAVL